MRLKREIAKVRIAKRKRGHEKIEKDTLRLTLQRNKALKEAELEAKKADALEAKRQAQLKKLKAVERIKAVRSSEKIARDKKRKAQAVKAKKTAKKVMGILGKYIKPIKD